MVASVFPRLRLRNKLCIFLVSLAVVLAWMRLWNSELPDANLQIVIDLRAHAKKINYSFVEASSYQGPVVEGWPPGRSRHLPDYVRPGQDNFPVVPQGLNVDSPTRIVAFVFSPPESAERRQAIRETWARGYSPSDNSSDSYVVFLLGHDGHGKFNDKVLNEAKMFGDLLVADFEDHYNNLTLKSIFALQFFTKLDWKPQYFIKIDDDSYVNLPALTGMLSDLETMHGQEKGSSEFLLGSGDDSLPIRDFAAGTFENERTVLSSRAYPDRWGCPEYLFDGDSFPARLSGAGYLMTAGAAGCIYSKLLLLPFLHIEDVFITGFGSQECDLPVLSSERFRHFPAAAEEEEAELGESWILLHYRDSAGMRRLHSTLNRDPR